MSSRFEQLPEVVLSDGVKLARFTQGALNALEIFCEPSEQMTWNQLVSVYPRLRLVQDVVDQTAEFLQGFSPLDDGMSAEETANAMTGLALAQQAQNLLRRVLAHDPRAASTLLDNITDIGRLQDQLMPLTSIQTDDHLLNARLRSFRHVPETISSQLTAIQTADAHATSSLRENPLSALFSATDSSVKHAAASRASQVFAFRAQDILAIQRLLESHIPILSAKYGHDANETAELLEQAREHISTQRDDFAETIGVSSGELRFSDMFGRYPAQALSPYIDGDLAKHFPFQNTVAAMEYIAKRHKIPMRDVTLLFNTGSTNFTSSPMSLDGTHDTGSFIHLSWTHDAPLQEYQYGALVHEFGHALHQHLSYANLRNPFWKKDPQETASEVPALLFQSLSTARTDGSDPSHFANFVRRYVFAKFEMDMYAKKPQTLEHADQLWDEIIAEVGLQPDADAHEWRFMPNYVSHPLYELNYLKAWIPVFAELMPALLPVFQREGMSGVVRLLETTYLNRGWAHIADLMPNVRDALRRQRPTTMMRRSVGGVLRSVS